MSATPKVSGPQVEAALRACKGRIAPAAVTLGIARNNLYKRMAALGISPDQYRKGNTQESAHRADTASSASDVDATGASRPTEPVERSDSEQSAHVSRSAIYSDRFGARKLQDMATTAAPPEAVEETGRVPRASKSLYLRPEQFKALHDASIDLPAVLREKLSPSKVMEMFMDECFADWLKRALRRGGAR